MMIFQHTIDKVLSGEKTQTSRIWQDDYTFSSDEYDRDLPNVVLSMKAWDAGKIRKLYYVGQSLAVQKARGTKGIARIRITELAKRDVRDFDEADFAREGFEDRLAFYRVWYGMHFAPFLRLLDEERVTPEWWLDAMRGQIPEHNTALVIRFTLEAE